MGDKSDDGPAAGADPSAPDEPTPRPAGGPLHAGDALAPPPGFAGGPPIVAPPPWFGGGAAAPPPGFAGPGPRPIPGGWAVPPVPPDRPAPSPPKRGPGPRRFIFPALCLIAFGAIAIWVFSSRDDAKDTRSSGAPATSGETPSTTDPGVALAPDGPGAAYTAWVGAIANSDTDTGCALLTKDTLDRLARTTTCATAMTSGDGSIAIPGAANGVVILGEAIDGARAEVSYQINGMDPATNPAVLELEDGSWKVALFAKPSGLGNLAGAENAACDIERRTVETAIEAYRAATGHLPPDAQALVGDYLQKLPPNTRVNPDGTITLVNDCA